MTQNNNSSLVDYTVKLQQFQSQRLRGTYADFSQTQEFSALVEFFFTHIYGTQDFGFRDESIKTLHSRLSGFLKSDIVTAVGKVIALNELTEKLDTQLALRMQDQEISDIPDIATYADIYRSLDKVSERVSQIELMIDATRRIHQVSRMWLIGISLKAVHRAAHIAGYGKIMDFLMAGYQAFHRVTDIRPFLEAVNDREHRLNKELFGA